MPVSFSYAGAKVLCMYSSNVLMNELSCKKVSDLASDDAEREPIAAPIAPRPASFRNPRRDVACIGSLQLRGTRDQDLGLSIGTRCARQAGAAKRGLNFRVGFSAL